MTKIEKDRSAAASIRILFRTMDPDAAAACLKSLDRIVRPAVAKPKKAKP